MVVQRFAPVHGVRRVGLGLLVTAAAVLMVGLPGAASGSARAVRGGAAAVAGAGAVYGGVSAQGWPVVIELNKSGRRVVRAVMGLRLRCTSGAIASIPDNYARLPVSRKGRFRGAFGPETARNSDGTTTDFSGSVTGALNAARTRISGTWRFRAVDHDSAGTVTDTCDSGPVRWTAKQ